jgi:hypothetical protein
MAEVGPTGRRLSDEDDGWSADALRISFPGYETTLSRHGPDCFDRRSAGRAYSAPASQPPMPADLSKAAGVGDGRPFVAAIAGEGYRIAGPSSPKLSIILGTNENPTALTAAGFFHGPRRSMRSMQTSLDFFRVIDQLCCKLTSVLW